ncbi:MAG: methyltransferase domain-containing protein [Bacilli bacterium]|nr:methyltransferase domain-containing protein [Bacilli bacterium]
MKEKELEFYEQIKDWSFDEFEIKTERLTDWDMYKLLKKLTDENSKILDLGTGGGEKVLSKYPTYLKEVLAVDLSEEMIKTATKNLKKTNRKNITFKVMDNLNMNTPKEYFDVVVARHTPTDPKQIYETLKKGGYLIVQGVDMYDCHELKRIFGRGQAFHDNKPISIIDYENILDANFKDVELIPVHEIEYFKDRETLYKFLLKVPILDDFSEEENDVMDHYKTSLEIDKLDEYIKRNTYSEGIKLQRRLYGIIAKK